MTIAQKAISIAERFLLCRRYSEQCCAKLQADDYMLQAAVFASPPKWHLAHTSWFFETFLLKPFVPGYQPLDPHYEVLFNSYYNGIGDPYPRHQRGLLSRPSLDAVFAYRRHIDEAMTALLREQEHPDRREILKRTRLGIEHEQQHQELFYTDIKFSLAHNPLYPALLDDPAPQSGPLPAQEWIRFDEALVKIGVDSESLSVDEFAFDNENPEHRCFLPAFSIGSRLVSNGEFQQFVDDGGYQRPELWLADGWAEVQQQQWTAPLYWKTIGGSAMEFSLYGLIPRHYNAPVSHISGYEADAYARWAGARLPTEAEWEHAANSLPQAGNERSARRHPAQSIDGQPDYQWRDQCWQWTSSAYRPYPGFKIADGAIGEYNGKFMCNQWVLRGGSCVTSPGHLRNSYRNFFYPADRWQFSGLRLAKDGI